MSIPAPTLTIGAIKKGKLETANAQVSAVDGTTGQPTLAGTPALIALASVKAAPQAGGVVRYDVLLPAGTDIKAGDRLTIDAWGAHTIDPAYEYLVFSADLTGGPGTETIRALVGDTVGR